MFRHALEALVVGAFPAPVKILEQLVARGSHPDKDLDFRYKSKGERTASALPLAQLDSRGVCVHAMLSTKLAFAMPPNDMGG